MKSTILIIGFTVAVEAHVGAFTTGMYCRGGNNPASENRNTNLVVNPLYNLTKSQWWMQADRGCDKVPPPEGEFLDLPAGGSFTAELAINRAFTSLSYDGEFATDWPDGLDHPEDWAGPDAQSCLMDNPDGEGGALHTKSQEASAGTAWAISYAEDLASVTMENLVVFSVLEHTPWKRLATYDVPADLPACPEQGCYCAWLWIPDGCGEPNMYMQNFRCRVTNATSTKSLGTAQVPVPCADDPSTCVSGPKQMIAWNQAEGNNVGDIGFSPAYNAKLGFLPGAQNDIFQCLPFNWSFSDSNDHSPGCIRSIACRYIGRFRGLQQCCGDFDQHCCHSGARGSSRKSLLQVKEAAPSP
ncbi:hypothetical protein B0T11DRAFT_351741 [Plectosphaerella cucumerina]|uniref:Proteophosphoglycan ppg4 n=1 Tax=Plectosphaerella cucumerina TaxID=40658 RepID=A0A8K0X353_9PEZI|nr:hypothetical protein B0T11DRAFT_351741 [Plectosphaerella cucumerina]